MSNLREHAVENARACLDNPSCPVNGGAYCMFGPSDACAYLAADYLDLSALVTTLLPSLQAALATSEAALATSEAARIAAEEEVADWKRLTGSLVQGMRWWAAQEDGVPNECWLAFDEAYLKLGWVRMSDRDCLSSDHAPFETPAALDKEASL